MKNLWKLFAVSAFALVPATANAAISVDNGVCSAATADEMTECLENSATKSLKLTAAGTYTFYSGGSAVSLEEITADAASTINVYGNVTVKKINDTDITINIEKGGKLTLNEASEVAAVTADGTTNGATLLAKDLTATTLNATQKASVTINGTLTATLTASEEANVTVTSTTGKGVDGAVTANTKAIVNVTAKTIGIDGNVTLGNTTTDKATLTVKASTVRNAIDGNVTTAGESALNITSGDVAGVITMSDKSSFNAPTSKVTPAATSSITGGTMTAKEIANTNLTVNGAKAIVKYVKGDIPAANFTAGTIVSTVKNSVSGLDEKIVTTKGVDEVTVANGEVYNINDMDAAVVAITAANGAIIRNEGTGAADKEVVINESKIKVVKDANLVVSNGTPTEPTDPDNKPTDPDNKPTDPDKVPDVPKTGDTVLVSSALGLVSLVGLAATVKSRKFN